MRVARAIGVESVRDHCAGIPEAESLREAILWSRWGREDKKSLPLIHALNVAVPKPSSSSLSTTIAFTPGGYG